MKTSQIRQIAVMVKENTALRRENDRLKALLSILEGSGGPRRPEKKKGPTRRPKLNEVKRS